ncbi:MAG: 4'-phosphopantetheinyl transferase superfamily protein [Acidimicrobiia bacterium]|nr:4'-phosphopantetheinyl transferase superfamily protein [Acidimicrobiia bacterium]
MSSPLVVDWLAASLSDVPAQDDWVDKALAARLATMVYEKRYSEARLARWTAKRAVALTLGLGEADLRGVQIRNAPDGAPEAFVAGAPVPGVIAMTDRADWAVCMVARGHDRVGCDLEVVEPRSRPFVADYFTVAEQEATWGATDPDFVANLIWSAKESALKVLRTGLRRDTRTVEVTLLSHNDGIWNALEVKEPTGRVLPGWWVRHGDFVLTCAAERSMETPRSLVATSPLAGAQPSHRWMDRPLRTSPSVLADTASQYGNGVRKNQ